MEIKPADVQKIEGLVRSVVTEVFRSCASAPKFMNGRAFEKRVSTPRAHASEISSANPVIQKDSAAGAGSAVRTGSAAGTGAAAGASSAIGTSPAAGGGTVNSAVLAVSGIPAAVPGTPPAKRLKSDELLLDKQILTLRDVEHLPRAVKRLIVPQTALLTPSVRDELEEHGIRLARYSAEAIAALSSPTANSAAGSAASAVRSGALEVYALFTPYHPESLCPLWTRSGWHPNLRSGFVCFDGLRSSMAKNVTLNVLFTSKVDEALCRLNRDEKIRAISSVSPQKLETQWKNFSSANTLVVNPSEIGIYLAGQIVLRAAELFYA